MRSKLSEKKNERRDSSNLDRDNRLGLGKIASDVHAFIYLQPPNSAKG
jgi:hypothetical protein